jgi:hypothetical protein
LASIQDVVAALRGALDQIDTARRRLIEAGTDWRTAAVGYSAATPGSHQPEVVDLASLGGQVQNQIRDADQLVGRCQMTVTTIIDRLVGGIGPAAPSPADKSRGETGGRADHQTSHGHHAAVIRRELRRIGRTGYGVETRGAWINDDGTAEPVTSGTATPWYRRTRAVLAGLGRRNTALDTHCEAQAVVRMQQEGRRHGTLVLSRPPCGVGDVPARPYTCDTRLGVIIRRLLPSGSTLTVVDPDGKTWTYPKEGEE